MYFVWLIMRLSDGVIQVARGDYDLKSWRDATQLCSVHFPSEALLIRFKTRLPSEREYIPLELEPVYGHRNS